MTTSPPAPTDPVALIAHRRRQLADDRAALFTRHRVIDAERATIAERVTDLDAEMAELEAAERVLVAVRKQARAARAAQSQEKPLQSPKSDAGRKGAAGPQEGTE